MCVFCMLKKADGSFSLYLDPIGVPEDTSEAQESPEKAQEEYSEEDEARP